MEYTQVGQFAFLRDSRYDIANQPWAQPLGRQAMDTYFKILRAEEELKRVRIKVKRLITFISDEEELLSNCIHELLGRGEGPLALQLKHRFEILASVNNDLLSRIELMAQKQGSPITTGTVKAPPGDAPDTSHESQAGRDQNQRPRLQTLGTLTSVMDNDSDSDEINQQAEFGLDILEIVD
jgi:hypothetical protein